jgi:hypothetical protein
MKLFIPAELIIHLDHAIGQAVSFWLPTAAARVRAQVRSCGICGGQSDTGKGYSEYLGFPANFHSTNCSTLIIYHRGLVQ